VSPLALLGLAAFSFVATHFIMSHPLRALLVAKLGERGFGIAYTVVAFITLGWTIWAFRQVPAEQPLWVAGDAAWLVTSLLMWVGSILFIGSLRRNPALPRPGKVIERIDDPHGVYAITRHPMMWGFALWALVHAIVDATPASLILTSAIAFLALVGAGFQDSKKAQLMAPTWEDWKARTSFVPFARGGAIPGMFALLGGTILFFAATWAHPPAGFFRWFG
jgi:uncharacterized membrane protein